MITVSFTITDDPRDVCGGFVFRVSLGNMLRSLSYKKITQQTDIRINKIPKVDSSGYAVFDAVRDNKGKGIKAMEFLKILKKISD